MRQSHIIISNALITWASRILLLVPQLIIVPYLIATIGETGYGVYALVWSLMMSIELLQRSLQSGVIKYSAGYLAQGRIDEVNKVVISSSLFSIMLAVAACAGTLIAARYYKDPSGQIRSALEMVGIVVLFIFPLTPYLAVIQSRQRYYVGAIAETASKYLGMLILVIWFHILGPSVEALILIMTGMLFLSRLVQVPIAYRMVPGLRTRLHLFDWRHFRLITAFGAANVLSILCIVANSTGIRWLMASLVSTSFIAHLAIMLMPGALMGEIIGAISITAMPATSAYAATGNQQMLQELLARGIRYIVMLSFAGLICANILMKPVLEVWIGNDYVFLVPYAFTVLTSAAFMQTSSIAHYMLKGLGLLRIVVYIYFLGLVAIPFAVILFVLWLLHNPYAAVTAGLVIGHMVSGILHVVFGIRAVHGNLRRVLWSAYAQPALVAASVWLSALGILHCCPNDSILGRVGVATLAIIQFSVTTYLLIVTNWERQQLKQAVRLVLRRLALV